MSGLKLVKNKIFNSSFACSAAEFIVSHVVREAGLKFSILLKLDFFFPILADSLKVKFDFCLNVPIAEL